MDIIAPPPAPVQPTSIPDAYVMQTPRTRMIAIILKALLQGERVVLGHEQLRLCKRGETFEDGDYAFEALQTGLYQRFGVWEQQTPLDGPPHHYTWCHVGDLGWFEDTITPILDKLTAFERECTLINITFPRAMKDLRAHRGRLSPSA